MTTNFRRGAHPKPGGVQPAWRKPGASDLTFRTCLSRSRRTKYHARCAAPGIVRRTQGLKLILGSATSHARLAERSYLMTYIWTCGYGDMWYICKWHMHEILITQGINKSQGQHIKRSSRNCCVERGTAKPMPVSRKCQDQHACIGEQGVTIRLIQLRPGSGVAAKPSLSATNGIK